MSKFIMFILFLGITACAVEELSRNRSETSTAMESAPIEARSSTVAMPAPSVTVEKHSKQTITEPINNNLLYKAYLLPEDKLSIELVSFVYLPKKPTSDKEKKLYLHICKAWSDTLLSHEEAFNHYEQSSEKLVPFYWTLRTKLDTPNCDKMIEQYDYARTQQLLRKHKLNVKKAQLIALYKQVHITLDVSSMVDDEDVIKSFQVWSTYMIKVPEKNDVVYVFTMVESLKKVLGALDYLITTKLKG